MTKAVCLIFTLAFPSLSLQGVASQTGGFQAGVPRPTQVFKTISRGSLRPSGFHNTKRLPAFSTVLAFAPMCENGGGQNAGTFGDTRPAAPDCPVVAEPFASAHAQLKRAASLKTGLMKREKWLLQPTLCSRARR